LAFSLRGMAGADWWRRRRPGPCRMVHRPSAPDRNQI